MIGMAEETSREITTTPPKRGGPLRFFQEVRREGIDKVTWPSWRETYLTTIMVFIMVGVSMVFFAVVDYTLGLGLNFLLGI